MLVSPAGWTAADAQSSPDVTTPGAISSPPGATPPDNSGNGSGNGSGNSSDNSTAAQPANPQDSSAAQSSDLSPGQNPNESKATPNVQVPNTPLLPQYPGNAFTPFSTTSSLSPAQSPQITSPQLYTTGTRDLSQIATNTGLRQAFSDLPSTSGFLSNEQEGGYSYPPIERIRLGPFDLKSALVSNVVYDDNLRINGVGDTTSSAGGSKSDTSFTLTPAVLLEYGAHEGQRGFASLVYSPTFERFYHHSDQDTDNYQNVAVNASYPFQRLTLDFGQTYSQTAGVNQDTNSRTVQTASSTTFGGDYILDDKMSITVQAQYVKSSYSAPQGTTTAPGQVVGQGDETSSINSTLNYKLTDKLSLNPSVNFGVDKPEDAPQQTFEQVTMGATYQPTEKIAVFGQAGLELQQFAAGSNQGVIQPSGNATNPIFSAGVGYSPFDSTSLTLNASQSVRSSNADSSQTVVSSSVSVAATQRFFQRLFLNGTINYSHSEGQDNAGAIASSLNVGSQDIYTYRASLSIAPTAWTSASLYYQYLDNESDQPGETYHDNQIGISLSAQF